jgi:WD40 repeat protein
MAASGKRLRVFISSPADVRPERLIAQRVVDRLDREFSTQFRVEPVLWEREPLVATEHFQTLITPPHDTDIVVVILWSRLGARLPDDKPGSITGRHVTGTEWEFEDAVASYRSRKEPDILLYRKKAEVSFSVSDRSEIQRRLEQIDLVDDFMRRWFHDETTGGAAAASWSFETATELEGLLDTHLRELLTRRVEGAVAEGEIRWHEGSPFRSLQSFELEHAPVFFGRTRARNELRELLAQRTQNCAFVLVLGASGSGKSSLVKAGLLPDLLLPGMIGKVALCRYAIFRPGDRATDLIGGLAAATIGPTGLPELAGLQYDPASLAAMLRPTSGQSALPIRQGLARAAEAAHLTEAAEARLLLIIDQLEELFTHESVPPQAREEFVETLAVLSRSGVVWVVATMRSDFFERLDQSPTLATLSSGARYLLTPPDNAEIGEIVQQPARAAGLRFEVDAHGSSLDAVIREAASAHPGSLPLLEFTLDQLWQRRAPPGLLTFAAYEELGGLEGALGRRAEEEFAKLPDDVRAALPSVLRSLVTVGQGARDAPTARPAPLARLPTSSAERRLVDAFLAPHARLLVAESDGAEPRVRIAHEALLTHWPRATRQIAADRIDLQLRARLEQAATVWRTTPEQEQDGRLLVAGLPLSEAQDLLTRRRDALDTDVVTYIEQSTSVAQLRESKRVRRFQMLSAVFALLTLGALVGAWLAFQGRTTANLRANQLQDALGHLLGATAQRFADPVNAETAPVAAALAAEGWRLARTADAWHVAHRLPITGVVAAVLHDNGVSAIAFSSDGTLFASGSDDRTARLVATSTGAELRRITLDRPVSSVAFSVDGHLLVVGSDDKAARLIDTTTGEEVARIVHDGPVRAVAFSPDGRLLATGSDDKTVRLFKTGTWEEVGRVSHGAAVLVLAFSSDSRLLATGSSDKTARVIETARVTETTRVTHGGSVVAVALSPDTRWLATGSDDHTARVIDTMSGKETLRLLHEGPVLSVAFSRDGRLIATGSGDNLARLIDRQKGEVISRILHGREVGIVMFSPDGRRLASGSGDGFGRLIDVATARETARISHEGAVGVVAFSPDGRLLATGNGHTPLTFEHAAKLTAVMPDRAIARFQAAGGQVLMVSADSGTILGLDRFGKGAVIFDVKSRALKRIPHDDQILAGALSPDGRLLATAVWGTSAKLLQLPQGVEVARIDDDGQTVAYAFSPDGRWATTAHADGMVSLVENATRRELWRTNVTEAIQDVVFSPDTRLLAIVAKSGAVRIVESATGRRVAQLTLANVSEEFVFSPDGRHIVIGGGSSLRLFDTATGNSVATLAHGGWVLARAFSPDSRLLATGSRDNFARVFDANSGKELSRVAHGGFVMGVAFSPDNRTLASVGDDRAARLSEVETGKEVVRLALTHEGRTDAVAFSPDTRLLITSDGADVRLWSLDLDDVFRQLCAQRGQNLSLTEWNRYVGNTPWRATCDCWLTPADVIAAGLWSKEPAPSCLPR